jgi:hypothetical protein
MRPGIPSSAALVILAAAANGYGMCHLNIDVPCAGVPQGILELALDHRFLGDAFEDPFGDFFGIDAGANVSLGLRYFVADGIDVGFSRTRALKEYTAGASWSRVLGGPGIEALVFAGYTTVEPVPDQDREDGFVSFVTFSAGPFGGKFIPVACYAYDGRLDRNGPGFGLEVMVSERFSLTGEYFPVTDRSDGDLPEDAFSFGARYAAPGHQFLLGFSNSPGIGIRGQLEGAATNDLSVAFTVRRMFSL